MRKVVLEMALFDNIKIPLEDLTEEEIAALDNDPGFQEQLEKDRQELKRWRSGQDTDKQIPDPKGGA